MIGDTSSIYGVLNLENATQFGISCYRPAEALRKVRIAAATATEQRVHAGTLQH